jgi:hypothetical protein
MKQITKELARQQIGYFVPGQNGWSEYIDNCIAAKICPNCGDDLYLDEWVQYTGLGMVTFLGCSNCKWEDYFPI